MTCNNVQGFTLVTIKAQCKQITSNFTKAACQHRIKHAQTHPPIFAADTITCGFLPSDNDQIFTEFEWRAQQTVCCERKRPNLIAIIFVQRPIECWHKTNEPALFPVLKSALVSTWDMHSKTTHVDCSRGGTSTIWSGGPLRANVEHFDTEMERGRNNQEVYVFCVFLQGNWRLNLKLLCNLGEYCVNLNL